MTGAPAGSSRTMLVGASVWLLAAAGLGASGLLRHARPPLPQIVIVALTIVLLVLFRGQSAFRRWALAVDIRALVLIHSTRFLAGVYFLVLYGRGELPYAFAVPGGWGDIAVGGAAVVVCLAIRPAARGGRRAILAWNVFGLVDIALVIATATQLGMADPDAMRALLRLPLCLLPTFLVPIIIATHIIIFARLRQPVGQSG